MLPFPASRPFLSMMLMLTEGGKRANLNYFIEPPNKNVAGQRASKPEGLFNSESHAGGLLIKDCPPFKFPLF